VSDTPKKAIRPGCPSISNAAPRAAVRIDHQFSARAEGSPFLRSLGWFSPVPGAKFLGELPDTLDAIFRDENRDLAQPLRSWGSGWRPALVHQRVPGRYPAPVRAIQQTGKAGESGAMVSERATENTRKLWLTTVNSSLACPSSRQVSKTVPGSTTPAPQKGLIPVRCPCPCRIRAYLP